MEMVFNGYSLTGFSITIYNNIIIINTKILMYNKQHKNYLINIYVYIKDEIKDKIRQMKSKTDEIKDR